MLFVYVTVVVLVDDNNEDAAHPEVVHANERLEREVLLDSARLERYF